MLDVAAMKHIAYVFDALIYYMRSGTDAAAAVRRMIVVLLFLLWLNHSVERRVPHMHFPSCTSRIFLRTSYRTYSIA